MLGPSHRHALTEVDPKLPGIPPTLPDRSSFHGATVCKSWKAMANSLTTAKSARGPEGQNRRSVGLRFERTTGFEPATPTLASWQRGHA